MTSQKEKDKMEELLQARMLEQRIMELQQEFQELEKKEQELSKVAKSLGEIKKDKEILSNIGPGIFVKTKVLDENLFFNIGSQTIVKKTVGEIKKIVEEQVLKVCNLKHKKQEEFNELLISLQKSIS